MNWNTARYRHPKRPLRLRWLGLKTHWSAVVLLVACAFAGYLYDRSPQPGDGNWINGVVDAEAVVISPVETARIKRILVAEGQDVRQGDLLVEMDTALVAHGVTADMIDAIRIETAFGDTHQDILQAVSQRIDAVAGLDADIAVCRQDWEREKGELEALRVEQERRDNLRKTGIIDDLTRGELLPQIAALEKAVALYPVRIAMYEKQMEEARTYHRNILRWLGVREGEAISEAIRRRINEEGVTALLRQAKNEANLHTQAYRLRAPQDGIVSAIFCREGSVAAADTPLMRLSSPCPSRIKAYLSESQGVRVYPGQRLAVLGVHRRVASRVLAVVESISPELNVSAAALSPSGRPVPLRTRDATLRIEGRHPFLGGETVLLRAESGRLLDFVSASFGT